MKLFTGVFAALLTIIDTTFVHEVKWDYFPSYSLQQLIQCGMPPDFLPQINYQLGAMPIIATNLCAKACEYVYRSYKGSYSYGKVKRKHSPDSKVEYFHALRCKASYYEEPNSDVYLVKEGNKYKVYTTIEDRDILLEVAPIPPNFWYFVKMSKSI